jgi:hypothetical protein
MMAKNVKAVQFGASEKCMQAKSKHIDAEGWRKFALDQTKILRQKDIGEFWWMNLHN